MLDLETLGKRPESVVLQIGLCVHLEPKHTRGMGDFVCLDVHVDRDHQYIAGRTDDESTWRWWMEDGRWEKYSRRMDEVVSVDGPPMKMREACEMVLGFLRDYEFGPDDEIWCNGMDFDFPILQSFFATARRSLPEGQGEHLVVPWEYWQQRDLRTLRYALAKRRGYKRERGAVAHDAALDALAEMRELLELHNELMQGEVVQ